MSLGTVRRRVSSVMVPTTTRVRSVGDIFRGSRGWRAWLGGRGTSGAVDAGHEEAAENDFVEIGVGAAWNVILEKLCGVCIDGGYGGETGGRNVRARKR